MQQARPRRYAMKVCSVLLIAVSCAALTHGPFARGATDSENHGVTQDYECLIEPMVTLELGSETQGLIDELYVDRGDKVSKGDVLATLKSDVEKRKVEQAATRADMSGEITAREADLKLARLILDRAASLHLQKLAPSQELDEARAQFQVAKAALQQADDNRNQLEVELLLARTLLAQRVIRSPVDGVVVAQHAHAGEFVHDNAIITIAQLNPLRVEVVLPLQDVGKYHVGDPATIIPEVGGATVNGVVDIVDPLLDSGSGTFGIRILINNDKGKLLAGQKCLASLSATRPYATVNADEDL